MSRKVGRRWDAGWSIALVVVLLLSPLLLVMVMSAFKTRPEPVEWHAEQPANRQSPSVAGLPDRVGEETPAR